MPSIVEVRPFEADLGAARATGNLFIADPIEDSIVRGTLRVLGLEDVSFEARVDTPFQVTVLGVNIVIKFDIPAQEFVGSTEQNQQNGIASHNARRTKIVSLA
jgi:hypothetical protein